MSRYLLQHHHDPRECDFVFASSTGHVSPFRHRATIAPCRSGVHAVWWEVEPDSEEASLALPPACVSKHTAVARVSEVEVL